MAKINLILTSFATLDEDSGILRLTFNEIAPDDDPNPVVYQSTRVVYVELPGAVITDLAV